MRRALIERLRAFRERVVAFAHEQRRGRVIGERVFAVRPCGVGRERIVCVDDARGVLLLNVRLTGIERDNRVAEFESAGAALGVDAASGARRIVVCNCAVREYDRVTLGAVRIESAAVFRAILRNEEIRRVERALAGDVDDVFPTIEQFTIDALPVAT